MTLNKEEIVKQGRPSEPNCFETDREEQWYRLGLYYGATANAWHCIADGDRPTKDGRYITFTKSSKGFYILILEYQECCGVWKTMGYQSDVLYWMELPHAPNIETI